MPRDALSRTFTNSVGNNIPDPMKTRLAAIPLLAVLLVTSAGASPSTGASDRRHPSHGVRPTPSPSVRVTIVNATTAPAFSLSTTGTNGAPAYPFFRQGDWTADPPFTNPVVDYVVRDTNGTFLAEQRITYKPVSKQYLLLTGDLSREGDPHHLRGVGESAQIPNPNSANNSKSWGIKPQNANLQFQIIPCEGVVKDPSHYRFVNCISGATLLLRKPPEGCHPAKEIALLTPGNSVLLTGQPDEVLYEAEVMGTVLKIEILQEGAVADCLIPIYLREGKPTYATIFESP